MRTSLEAVCCWGLRADRHVGHPGPPGPYVYKDGRQNHDAHAGPLAMVLTVVTEIRLPRYPPASHPRNRWNVVEVEEFLTWRLSATVTVAENRQVQLSTAATSRPKGHHLMPQVKIVIKQLYFTCLIDMIKSCDLNSGESTDHRSILALASRLHLGVDVLMH
jgi:hypothetical protein